ncbi:MAG: branched-chain amino acid ABC transporter permease [Proteobacteria bacterium]|nr:branched-chain amino acid ABC transporter permease [Pseudomonadota bacterium]
MNFFLQIIVSGLTLGAMYSLSAVGLSLVWGSFNMLNMAHGAIMTLGAYFVIIWFDSMGLTLWLAAPFALICAATAGVILYFISAHWMLTKRAFDTNIMIATIGISIALQTGLLKAFGGEPYAQPLSLRSHSFMVNDVPVSYQRLVIWATALILMVGVGIFLSRTNFGRAVRATAQNRDAAQLMGVRVRRVYVAVLALASVLAAVSGIMLSSMKELMPLMGGEPLLKAFIVIILAGLGNVTGALYAAILVGLLEAAVQVLVGAQYGFPAILIFVILVLIWKPAGLFGRRTVARQ